MFPTGSSSRAILFVLREGVMLFFKIICFIAVLNWSTLRLLFRPYLFLIRENIILYDPAKNGKSRYISKMYYYAIIL